MNDSISALYGANRSRAPGSAPYVVVPDGRITRNETLVGVWYALRSNDLSLPPSFVIATRDQGPRAVALVNPTSVEPIPSDLAVIAAVFEGRPPGDVPGWSGSDVVFGDVVAQVASSLAGDEDWHSTTPLTDLVLDVDDPLERQVHVLMQDMFPLPRGPHRAFRDFLTLLDPLAIQALREGRLPRIARQSWDGIDATFTVGAPLRRALDSLPDLANTLVSAWMFDRDAFASDMRYDDAWAIVRRETIRRGLPRWAAAALPEALSTMPPPEVFSVPDPRREAVLITKRQIGARGLPVGYPPYPTGLIDDALQRMVHFEYLPADRLPHGEGWKDYAQATQCLHALRHSTGPDYLDKVLGLVGADWVGYLKGTQGPNRLGGRGNRLVDVADYGSAYASQVVAPALRLAGSTAAYERAARLARVVLNSGRTVGSWVAASERWHAHASAIDAKLAALPGEVLADPPWKPCFPDLRIGDVEVRVLTCVADLVAEGLAGDDVDGVAGLDHCVGGYGPQCRAGTSRILSLSRVNGVGQVTRMSTVEIVFREDGQWMVNQHSGAGNAEPSDDARDALGEYLARSTSPRLKDLEPVPEPEEGGARYDWRHHGNWEVARDAWAPLVPRAARELTPEEWVRIDELSGPLGDLSWLPSSPALMVVQERPFREIEFPSPRP